MPIRLRLTVMTVALLTFCCIGLTLTLNFSAEKMATKIDATPVLPAQKVEENVWTEESIEAPENVKNPENSVILPNSTVASQKARMDFRFESIIYMLIVILGGGLSTYYISGSALRPLEKLNGQVQNINVHNLSKTLTVPPTKDEIAELTATFNKMTGKLDDSFKMQRRFSASAAHELRTPLAVLQTKVDVFKKVKMHTKEEYDTLISVIEKQTKRLRGLVSNLLDMTNMENQDTQVGIDVEYIFEDIISDLSHIANDYNVTLSLDCDHSVIFGNIPLLHRAFYNLVENAIKYNVGGGTVEIIVNKLSDEQVAIKIKDTGIGISHEEKKHIFEPFYRVDKSRSRQMGGTGLGLSTVDDIIKKHDGIITVTDNWDVGTCFTVTLNKGYSSNNKFTSVI